MPDEKKIAIMTWFTHRNYGTALQAVAISKVIKDNGYEPSLINYQPKRAYEKRLNLSQIIGKAKSKIIKKNQAFLSEERESLYLQFLNENVTVTEPLRTQPELISLNGKFDAFVCGSDQIWSPLSYNDKYFLSFVSNTKKMVSYAPSFGTIKFGDENVKKSVSKLVKRFDHLSVREKQGAKIIEELTGKKADVVLDPTLLLDSDKWDKITDKKTEEINALGEYIICYFLGDEKKYLKRVKKISKENNIPYYIIPVKNRHLKLKNVLPFEVGPESFVQLIKHAKYVCTDSFHGVAFSVNYNVPFSVFKRFLDKDKQNQNSRIFNILQLLGLEERIDGCGNPVAFNVDYFSANQKLKEQRQISLDYLIKSLESAVDSKYEQPTKEITSYCCGCGACVSVCKHQAVTVCRNEKGFQHYKIDADKCINCGLCKSVCPMSEVTALDMQNSLALYSIKSKDDRILSGSASGGIGAVLAQKFIEEDLSVCGCVYDTTTDSAKHVIANKEEINIVKLFQGSKYIQSETAEAIKELVIQAKNSKIAFFGTPCQVAGINNVLNKYSLRDNAILIDLICHGVPTYHLWEKYLKDLNESKNIGLHPQINFRDKRYPWHKRSISVIGNGKRYVKNDRKDDFYALFRRGLGNMPSCFECPYREKSSADIRIGDYWGDRYLKDKQGVSMVIANTARGKALIDSVENCSVKEFDLKEYWRIQAPYNPPKHFFYEQLIKELKDEEIKLHAIRKKYCTYYDRLEVATEFAHKLKRLIKR